MVQGGMKCIKYLLFLFNLTFVIFGILLITVGALAKSGYTNYHDIIPPEDISAPANLFVVAGVVMFFVAFLGCFGAVRENHCLMVTYSVVVGLVLILQLGAAIAAYTMHDGVVSLFEKGMNRTIDQYDKNEDIHKSWNFMQHKLDCCGIRNYTDWERVTLNNSVKVPDSCCIHHDGPEFVTCTSKLPNLTWNAADDGKYVNTIGCIDKVVNDISIEHLGTVGIVLGVIELIGVVFACFMARSIRYSYETV